MQIEKQAEKALANEQSDSQLTFKYCVFVAFKEWVVDLLFLPFPILMIVFTPWRATFLYGILIMSLENIPLSK